MNLYEYLCDTFGINEPIMTSDISYKDYSKPWLYKELNKLCENGKLIRFEKGIYYIPAQTVLGQSLLNPAKVIEKKYINDGTDIVGYYSGIAFMNKIGISTQMPNVLEIYTNNENAKVREVVVGKQKVVLRKSRTTVTSENAPVQSFIELMNSIPASYIDDEKRTILTSFIKKNDIARKSISEYAPFFPDKALRTMIESEIIYDVTR